MSLFKKDSKPAYVPLSQQELSARGLVLCEWCGKDRPREMDAYCWHCKRYGSNSPKWPGNRRGVQCNQCSEFVDEGTGVRCDRCGEMSCSSSHLRSHLARRHW